MIKRKWFFLLLIVTAIALVDAIYLTYHHYLVNILNPVAKSFCSINSYVDCDVVAKSKFSMMFGVPVASLGVFAYLFMTFFLFLVMSRVGKERQHIFISFGYPIFLLMLIFAVYQFFVSAFFVKSFCLMCSFLYLCGFLQVVAAKKCLHSSHKDIFKEFRQFVQSLFQKEGGRLSFVVISLVVAALVSLAIDRGIANNFTKQLRGNETLSSESRADQLLRQYNLLPQVPLSLLDTPMKGNPEAEVTLVEFSDFQCPACSKMATVLLDLLQEYPGKIRLYFKNYPLDENCNPKINRPFHQQACIAARYGYCAYRQNRFWTVHDKMFANQKLLTEQFFFNLIRDEKMDVQLFNSCLEDLAANKISIELKEAGNAGVNYTPSVFLNGRKISDIVKNRQDFKTLIESLLN